MKQSDSKRRIKNLILFFAPTLFLALFFLVCSFTAKKITNDFLKELGITKQSADEKITNSIIGGYIDNYGIKNAKNIALGNRKAVTLDLLNYIKKYVSSPAFVKEYNDLKERNKPKEQILQTPEEMQTSEIALRKKNVADIEANIKKTTDATVKKFFETSLEQAKQALKEAEDPNNKYFVAYRKNYPQSAKSFKDSYDRSIADWNSKYPQNQLLFVKKRLQEFLDATKDVDFSAELTDKNGKKIFVKSEYEHKDSRWKMAFRTGKEVVEPARGFVQKWIDEIK
jgi:hypothetical protein